MDASDGSGGLEVSGKITAIRETFEEVGVGLFQKPIKRKLSSSEWQDWRKKVHDDSSQFSLFMNKLGSSPSTSSLVYWDHWITPSWEKKRFDTAFFMSTIDQADIEADTVSADGQETLSHAWVSA